MNAGYGASPKTRANEKTASKILQEDALKDRDTPLLLKRLISSIIFILPLLYISMGHMMWNWPLPIFFDNNHVAMGLAQLLLAAEAHVRSSRDEPFKFLRSQQRVKA